MGDRASVKFKYKDDESPVLCAHWEGAGFHDAAKDFTDEVVAEAKIEGDTQPLFRLEPSIVMLEFIRTHFRGFEDGERVTSSYYLGKNRNEVDDSDNGCLVVDLGEAFERPSRMYSVEK